MSTVYFPGVTLSNRSVPSSRVSTPGPVRWTLAATPGGSSVTTTDSVAPGGGGSAEHAVSAPRVNRVSRRFTGSGVLSENPGSPPVSVPRLTVVIQLRPGSKVRGARVLRIVFTDRDLAGVRVANAPDPLW